MNRKINPLAAALLVLIVLGIVAFVLVRSTEAPLGGAAHGIGEAMGASAGAAKDAKK